MITELGSLRVRFMFLSLGILAPFSPVHAGGWWNHKSVVAMPIGPSVGTVQGAAPYQIFSAPSAAPAVYSAPSVSFYSAPVANYSPVSYSPVMIYGAVAPQNTNAQGVSSQNAFAAPQANSYADLGKQLADSIRQNLASANAQSAAPANGLTADEVAKLRDLLQRVSAPQTAAPATQMSTVQPAYVPVVIGFTQPSNAVAQPTMQQYAAPQQAVVPATSATMSLVPVQLYRQKNFLGHEKLKPVRVYPYGVR